MKAFSITKLFWITFGVLFIGSIIWSIIFETIMPLIRANAIDELILNIVGIPVILAGTIIFIRGGWIFFRDVYSLMGTEEIQVNIDIIRAKSDPQTIKQARRKNIILLWQSWKPGLKQLAWGFFLIAVGGMGINLLKILGQDQIF
ncbi:MAG: hypothetical protein QGD88_07100 [Anaerolineae bacterium]|nr:hypothetical protein [Anaerolineae bacterium]